MPDDHDSCHGHCDHDHSGGGAIGDELGVQFSLYTKIDLPNVVCLNETIDGSGKTVFKPWNERLERTQFVESDADAELLFNIPFTGDVKVKSLVLIGGEGNSHPKRVRLYKNRPLMTFDDTSNTPDQEFELTRDENGTYEYALKSTKFSTLSYLSLHFPGNFGGDHGEDEISTKIYYIGLRGDFLGEHRDQIVLATYEARPIPQDHKGELKDQVRHQIS